MIDIKDINLQMKITAGEASNEEIATYLIKNYNVWDIACALGEHFANGIEEIEPISISPIQFLKYFKVQGYRVVDGKMIKENRGRQSGSRMIDGKLMKKDMIDKIPCISSDCERPPVMHRDRYTNSDTATKSKANQKADEAQEASEMVSNFVDLFNSDKQ